MNEAPAQPTMEIILPTLSTEDLITLKVWAETKSDTFPTFAPWLYAQVIAEVNRRNMPDWEPGMEPLPLWSGPQLADALMGSHVLREFPLSDAAARYVDHVHLHVMCNAVAGLQNFAPEVRI